MILYENAEHGFSIEYPEGWTKTSQATGYRFCFQFKEPQECISASVSIEYRAEEVTLDDVVSEVRTYLKGMPELQLTSEGEVTTAGGISGYQMVGTGDIGTGKLEKFRYVQLVRGKQVLWVGVSAAPTRFDEHKELVDEMVDSFRLLPGYTFVPAPPSEGGTYTNAEYGFSISYPAGWVDTPEPQYGEIGSFWATEGLPGVMVRVWAEETSLAEAASKLKQQFSEVYPDYEFFSEGEITLDDGTAAHEIVFSATVQGYHHKCKFVTVVHEGNVFLLQGLSVPECFEQDEAVLDKVIRSFHLESARMPTYTPAPTSTRTPTPTPVPGEARITSHSLYMCSGSYREIPSGKTYEGRFLYVVGEIRNTGATNIRLGDIKVTLLDEKGSVIETDAMRSLVMPDYVLTPGDKAPFKKVLVDEECGKRVTNYELEVSIREATEEPYELEVVKSWSYISDEGTYYVAGEVQNRGSRNIELVKVYITYYDADGVVVDVDGNWTSGLDVLMPQEKARFNACPSKKELSGEVQGFAVSGADCQMARSTPYREFQILSHDAGTIQGYYRIQGEIKNIGDQNTEFVNIIATCYDADGKVIATGIDYADPRDLEPGQTGSFDIRPLVYPGRRGDLTEKTLISEVESYILQFQCSTQS